MRTKNCTECGDTYTAWTDAKAFCGGLSCAKRVAAPSGRIVGLRRGNYRRSPLDIHYQGAVRG